MRKMVVALLSVVSIAVGLSGVAGAETTGFQDFRVIHTGPPSNTALVIATGVATGTGTAVTPEGQGPAPFRALIVLDDGTIFLTIVPTGDELSFNPTACLLSGPFFGDYTVAGGTGRFTGATGGGTFSGHLLMLFDRTDGRCVDPASNPPRFVVQVIDNPGTLTLPKA